MSFVIKYWHGYYDLGPIKIPPLPQGTVFTDRTTGTEWLLTDTSGAIDITSTIPSNIDTRIYDAYDEPYMASDPHIRIYVDNGVLAVEYVSLPQGVKDRDTAPLYTRKASSNTIYAVTIPAGWVLADGVDGLDLTSE